MFSGPAELKFAGFYYVVLRALTYVLTNSLGNTVGNYAGLTHPRKQFCNVNIKYSL